MNKPHQRRVDAAAVAAIAVGGLALAGLLVIGMVYAGRRDLARQATLAWLRDQGISASVQFETIDPTRLIGRLQIGPAGRPDLSIDRFEVDYSLQSFLRGRGLTILAVKVRGPVLAARLSGGKLNLGSLDKLVQIALRLPSDTPRPRVEVESGVVLLTTDQGVVRLSGDAVVDGGQLTTLTAGLSPMRVRIAGVDADIGPVRLSARRSGDRLHVATDVQVASLRAPQGAATGGRLDLQADLSYAALASGRVQGAMSADLAAALIKADAAQTRDLRLSIQSPDLNLNGADKTASGGFRLSAGAGSLAAAPMNLDHVRAEGAGQFGLQRGVLSFRWTGGASGSGRSTALGGPLKADSPLLGAAKRSLQQFRWSIASAELSADQTGLKARLLSPARIRAGSGGVVTLSPVGQGYRLRVGGGGLPDAQLDVRRVRLTPKGGIADAALSAAFSAGPVDHAQIKADGRLELDGLAGRFFAASCVDLSAGKVAMGDNSAEALKIQVCPDGRPLLAFAPGRWTMDGKLAGATVRVPAMGALEDGAGALRLDGQGDRVSADLTLDHIKAVDLAKPLRFHPLEAALRGKLDGDLATGTLDLRSSKGVLLAHAEVKDDIKAGSGGATVSVPALTFAEGALQPSDVTPMMAALGEPVSGMLDVSGALNWTGNKITTSSGRVRVGGLSFRSLAGQVDGLTGEVVFTSLLPLEGATVGAVHADRIASVAPVSDLSATALIKDEILTLTDAHGTVGEGVVRIKAAAPFKQGASASGEVALEAVQVHDIIQASPFGDKMNMTAKVVARLPFSVQDGHIQVARSELKAVGGGRLSISRTALNGGKTPDPASVNAVTSFAYQAMENLSFTILDGVVESRPDGRLGMLFHIVGRNDPPKRQQLVLTLKDIFQGKFLNAPLPLPSDTVVNLTLDTTINLDNLVRDYSNLYRQLGSSPVQPAHANVSTDTSETHK